MTVQPISRSAVILFLTLAELSGRGLQPDRLAEEDTLSLAREGLALSGRAADDLQRLESYPSTGGLLLFIHTVPPAQSVWRFINSDALLDALSVVQKLSEGSLYWWGEAFWLITDDICSLQLSEFADLIEDDPLLPARLNEYALPLSPTG